MLIVLACALYGGLHSFLASMGVKNMVERRLGLVGRRFYRLFFNLLGAFLLLPVMLLPAWLPDRSLYRLPFPWSGVALLIQGLAGLGLIAAVLQTDVLTFTGFRQLFHPPASLTREGGTLVTNGLYRWMRHPIYTFSLVFLWGSPQLTQNFLILIVCFSAYFGVGAILEERKLAQVFGQAYLEYRARTPMFIPVLETLFRK
jgi:protein-S-isoprenylcysteine O-methyltransferase Ste14